MLSWSKMDEKLIAPCGVFCGECEFYTKEKTPYCAGCGSIKGHVFWGNCKLYTCASEHKVEHCGECSDFPCESFVNHYDPLAGQKNALYRAGLLAYRRKAGTEKYLAMVKKLNGKEKANAT
jgi:Zn-dependent alcohol dehydrogenase